MARQVGRRRGRPLKQRFRVETSERAKRDLVAIQDWHTQPGSDRVAAAKLAAISSALRDLRFSAHGWPLGEHKGVRERPVAGHRIFYRVDDEQRRVEVLRVFSPYQDRAEL